MNDDWHAKQLVSVRLEVPLVMRLRMVREVHGVTQSAFVASAVARELVRRGWAVVDDVAPVLPEVRDLRKAVEAVDL